MAGEAIGSTGTNVLMFSVWERTSAESGAHLVGFRSREGDNYGKNLNVEVRQSQQGLETCRRSLLRLRILL